MRWLDGITDSMDVSLGDVSILWASLMREARDREGSSRGGGQVPLKAHLAPRVCLSWWA